MKVKFKIGKRSIGDNEPPLIIAELGINHNGSLDRAIAISESAIKAGAEVIKHQTHIVEDEMIEAAKKIIPGNSNNLNTIFISTPFSRKAANRLQKFNIPAFKIGSGECNNYPLIKHIAKFKKPVILSTGMNSYKTIDPAVKILKKYRIPYALMHCTNIYPTKPELTRLGCIEKLKAYYPDALVGLSDHTTSNYTSYAAIALGAKIIERHFVDKKKIKGPDINCSMTPDELKQLIVASKVISLAIARSDKKPLKEEKKTIDFAFASVVSIKNILPGEKLNKLNIWVKRPGKGDFLAKDYDNLIGKISKKRIKAGVYIQKKHFI